MSSTGQLEELLRHAAWLRRFARGLLADGDAAEDVAQETLFAAWRQPANEPRGVRAWLAAIARHRAVDHVRQERRRQARQQAAAETVHQAPTDGLLGDLQVHRAVAEAIDNLAEPFRQTLVLRYFEGLTAAQIARQLGVPAGTVRWRVREGLVRVREALDARCGGDRSAWRRALSPLLPAPAPRPRVGLKVPVLAAALSGTAALTFVPNRAAEPPAPFVSVTTTSAWKSPAREAPVGFAAPSTCAAAVAEIHAAVVRQEADLFSWDHNEAYARGERNPAAEQALRPFVDRHLAHAPSPVSATRFLCRTWVCRLAIVRPKGGYGDPPGGAEYGRRVAATTSSTCCSHPDFADLRSGAGQMVLFHTMRLRHPSGQPHDGAVVVPPPRTPPAVPADAIACQRLRGDLEALRARITARWQAAEPRDVKFERSPPNVELTRLMDAHVPSWKRAFGTTECRGRVCKRAPHIPLPLPFVSLLWNVRFEDDPALIERYGEILATMSRHAHYVEFPALVTPP